jgi:predicted ester cyclase
MEPIQTVTGPDIDAAKAVALRSFELMRDGTFADFEALIHPDAVNHEEKDEPPESRGRGPRPFHATALWLRGAFAELDWEIHRVVAEGDLVVVHCTMTGRHVNTFVGYDEDARVADAFPATGKRFAVTQTHWIRIADGRLIEHWANRDDLGMAMQLGWAPPSPLYLLRMALAKRRARRH